MPYVLPTDLAGDCSARPLRRPPQPTREAYFGAIMCPVLHRSAPLSTERVERRLTAILAADVAGYSRLMGVDEEGTQRRRRRRRTMSGGRVKRAPPSRPTDPMRQTPPLSVFDYEFTPLGSSSRSAQARRPAAESENNSSAEERGDNSSAEELPRADPKSLSRKGSLVPCASFDHLVCAELDGLRDGQPKSLGGTQIDS
jgi:hypothetical protein